MNYMESVLPQTETIYRPPVEKLPGRLLHMIQTKHLTSLGHTSTTWVHYFLHISISSAFASNSCCINLIFAFLSSSCCIRFVITDSSNFVLVSASCCFSLMFVSDSFIFCDLLSVSTSIIICELPIDNKPSLNFFGQIIPHSGIPMRTSMA